MSINPYNRFSALDKISNYLSPAIRLIGDFGIIFGSTRSRLIRIKKITADSWAGNLQADVLGDTDLQAVVESGVQLISNIIVKYPSNKYEIFNNIVQQQFVGKTINPEEQLPIEFFLQFTGNYSTDPVAIQRDDVIIDYLLDESGNVMPLYLQVVQIFGSFFGKNIVRKSGTLVPFRGDFEKSIKEKVDAYIKKIIAGQLL